MFIIASCGRSGTFAICQGLNSYSDHIVAHEPDPLLISEAYLKHKGMEYRTNIYEERLKFFKSKAFEKYGESFRAPNLLPEIYTEVPDTKFLIMAREPIEYVISANAKRVFQKNDAWDQNRITPLAFGNRFDQLPLADKIAWHWVIENDYLVRFVALDRPNIKLAILSNLEKQIFEFAEFLDIQIINPEELITFLSKRPNSAEDYSEPPGFDQAHIQYISQPTWDRINQLATWK